MKLNILMMTNTYKPIVGGLEKSVQIFSDEFRKKGHQCDMFDSGEDFLKIAQPGQYDLMIMDIRLPGMDGVKLLRELRQREIFTAAILITAFNSLEYARDAVNASANYLLEKPFKFESLMRVINKVISSPQSLQDCVDRGLAVLDLTPREDQVARMLLKGLSNKEIASQIAISDNTVKQHISEVFLKAKVTTRGEFFSFIFPV